MELHREEKREKGDGGDQEEKRGNQKGRDRSSHNQFPKCSPQSGSLRDVHKVTEKRQVGDRGGQEHKRGASKGERSSQ